MGEYESVVAVAMEYLADAIRTHAAVMASCAASAHVNNPYDQRNMAAVIFTDAQERFADPLKKLNKRQREDLERYIQGLCKGKQ